jgi:hypothetical protein
MSDKAKAITFGLILGFAFGGLFGSATFGGWGGIIGSLLGLLVGGGTMALIASASLSAQAENPREVDSEEVNVKP